MPRRAALVLVALLVGCAMARAPSPGHPGLCWSFGQAEATVGSPTGAFPGKPWCHAKSGGLSSNAELIAAAIISTLGGLAMAGVF